MIKWHLGLFDVENPTQNFNHFHCNCKIKTFQKILIQIFMIAFLRNSLSYEIEIYIKMFVEIVFLGFVFFKTYNYLNKILLKQNLHHRTNSGKDSSNTKIVGVRNAKKSRNTPGLGSMYIERVMRVSRSHGYYVSSSCCFLYLSNGIDFFYIIKSILK